MGELRDWQAEEIKELEAELARYRNGYQGSCYACEGVAEKNVELEAEVERLRNWQEEALDLLTNVDPYDFPYWFDYEAWAARRDALKENE